MITGKIRVRFTTPFRNIFTIYNSKTMFQVHFSSCKLQNPTPQSVHVFLFFRTRNVPHLIFNSTKASFCPRMYTGVRGQRQWASSQLPLLYCLQFSTDSFRINKLTGEKVVINSKQPPMINNNSFIILIYRIYM